MKVRVINFQSKDAPAEFAAGLKEIGFAVISHHPISQDLIDQAYRVWYDFFKSDEKNNPAYAFDPESHDGYIPTELSETAKGYDKKDLKEFFHYYKGKRCPASCFEITSALSSELTMLASILLGWINDNAPDDVRAKFSMPLPEMAQESDALFRILHYPPLTGNEPKGALRAAAHEDINLLTMLPAATAEGLQVKDANGNWLDVPINPGWIIVNAGDMLQECSGHYYKSTAHRVLNPTGDAAKKSRLSMPLFLHAQADVVLSERYTAHSYLIERRKELGLL